jgi:hypothetical protein
MVGKVVGVSVSQRRTDPKKKDGKGFLQIVKIIQRGEVSVENPVRGVID